MVAGSIPARGTKRKDPLGVVKSLLGHKDGVRPHGRADGVRPHGRADGVRPHGRADLEKS